MTTSSSITTTLAGPDLTAESPLLNPFSSDGCLELMVTKGALLKSVMAGQAIPEMDYSIDRLINRSRCGESEALNEGQVNQIRIINDS